MTLRRLAPLLALACIFTAAADDRLNAIARFEARDDAAAAAELRALVGRYPTDAELLTTLGRAEIRLGRFAEAARHLRVAAQRSPADVRIKLKLGEALAGELAESGMLGKLKLAREIKTVLEQAVAADPRSVPAREAMLQFYLEAGIAGADPEKAQAEAAAIRALDAGRGHAAQASLLLHDGKEAAAIEEFRKAIAANPADAKAAFDLGLYFQQLERFDESIVAFEALVARDPTQARALYQIGKSASLGRTQLERGESALNAYLQAGPREDGDPRRAAAHWRLGMVHELQQRKEAARAQYQAALKLEPEFKQAQASLEALR